jgi:hypothetical protein
MTAHSQDLAEALAWLDAFKKRSEHFDDAAPASVWETMLRALALKTALEGDTASSEFRCTAATNLSCLVGELKEWDAVATQH